MIGGLNPGSGLKIRIPFRFTVTTRFLQPPMVTSYWIVFPFSIDWK